MAGRRVAVVASGDLAHVGPAFGGEPLDAGARAAVTAADDELVACMVAGDPAAFFAAISRVADCNNVCGVAPIYLTLRLLGDAVGEQAGYAVCPADEQDTSAVTVTGMVFRGR
jgi:predicted class III extradiol MEMO1 family dioxygenase